MNDLNKKSTLISALKSQGYLNQCFPPQNVQRDLVKQGFYDQMHVKIAGLETAIFISVPCANMR